MKFTRYILVALLGLCLSGFIHAQTDTIPTLWVVVQNDTDGIILMHTASGEAISLLGADMIKTGAEVRAQFSPSGEFIAVQVADVTLNAEYPQDFENTTIGDLELQNMLYVFNTDGDLLHSAPLLTDDFMLTQAYEGSDGFYMLSTFLRGGMVMSWSPDSTRLVYGVGTSGTGNPEDFDPNGYGTLHLWLATDNSVIELEDTPGTATDIQWSPNSINSVYRGVDNFGTGAGVSSTGTFVIRADNSVHQLPLDSVAGAEIFFVDDTVIHGWLDDNHVAFSDFAIEAGAGGLFVYDVDAGEITSLLPTVQINLNGQATGIDPETGRLYVFASYFIPTDELEDQFPNYADTFIDNGLHIYADMNSELPHIM